VIRRLVLLVAVVGGVSALLTACVAPPKGTPDLAPVPPPFTAAASPTQTAVSAQSRILADARKFVYRVRNTVCLATGSSFATVEGILTNRHVASGAASLQLSTWDGSDFDGDVASISVGPDLSIIKSTQVSRQPPTVRTAQLKTGTRVWAAGYPEGDQLAVTSGAVIAYVAGSKYGEPGGVMEISNLVQHGNSGGPLLDSRDRVVGVVFAIDNASGDGLAIPASTLSTYLDNPGNNSAGDCIS
jgi:S1-C subfamily serine protease